MKKMKLFSIGAMAIITGALLTSFTVGAVKPNNKNTVFANESVQSEMTASTTKEATELVIELHNEMNNLVGYGAIKQFSDPHSDAWDRWNNSTVAGTDFEALSLLFNDEEIQSDIVQLDKISEIVSLVHDDEGLRYIHRILHDLEYYVLNTGDPVTKRDHFYVLASDPSVQGRVIEVKEYIGSYMNIISAN